VSNKTIRNPKHPKETKAANFNTEGTNWRNKIPFEIIGGTSPRKSANRSVVAVKKVRETAILTLLKTCVFIRL